MRRLRRLVYTIAVRRPAGLMPVYEIKRNARGDRPGASRHSSQRRKLGRGRGALLRGDAPSDGVCRFLIGTVEPVHHVHY